MPPTNSENADNPIPEFIRVLLEKWLDMAQLNTRYPNLLKFIKLVNGQNIALVCGALSKWYANKEGHLQSSVSGLFETDGSLPSFEHFPHSDQFIKYMQTALDASALFISQNVVNQLDFASVLVSGAVTLTICAETYRLCWQISQTENLLAESRETLQKFCSEDLHQMALEMLEADREWEELKRDSQDRKRFPKVFSKISKTWA